MRVLVVHNRYRSENPSGENAVVAEEPEQLRRAGVDVSVHTRDSDEIAQFSPLRKGLLAAGPVYSPSGVAGFRESLAAERPDVVHLHNVYPLISPWVVREAHRAGVPVVQTVHNYRHACVKGTFFRDGRPCEDCLHRRIGWPGVVHRCYRDSTSQSLSMVAGAAAHRGTWRSVDRLLPVSAFVGRRLVEAGFPPERITVRHQGIEDAGRPGPPGAGVLFVGRLDEEKGVPDLLSAWESVQPPGALTLVGDGPLRADAERVAARCPSVRVLGALPRDDVRTHMAACGLVVVPSRCYEGLPRVAVEAFMSGRPVLCSAVGSLAELVDDQVGWRAPVGVQGLSQALLAAVTAQDLAAKARAARARYDEEFTVERSIGVLLHVYREVIAGAAEHARRPT